MAKGISNTVIIHALVFMRTDVELVSDKHATRFDGVKIVERWNQNVVVCRPTCMLIRYLDFECLFVPRYEKGKRGDCLLTVVVVIG